eukprot:TRINITY_DN26627_c0_g1_i2.p1 TRINITY_DN26627_c0_g1~~TRINITY_DN26627_c0_g1_i2.p1  ORF type:complete len:217 (-),score=28.39 TRINITY_DN26627_c0_g1_i2:97-747(-)
MIKVYQEWGDQRYPHSYRPAGAVSNFLANLSLGGCAQFKHIGANLKISYPFVGVRTITMIAVGAGIAPMIQALHKLLETKDDDTHVVLLYGNRTVPDILMRDRLELWASHPRFRFIPVVGSRWNTNVRVNMQAPKLPEGFEELSNPRLIHLSKELQEQLWGCTSNEERMVVQEAHLERHAEELRSLEPVAELGWVNQHVIKTVSYTHLTLPTKRIV